MENGLRTEEFGKKKNTTKIMIILLLLIVIITIALCTYYYITNKKKEEAKKKTIEITSLNEELQDIYGFAISNNYIVALKNNGSMIKIYNLLQGTGNLGNFTYYTYYNDKLYLLFEDNNLYTISLTDGNKVYELTKNLTLENLQCSSNNIGKTSDLAFSGKTIYFNTSSCGISRLSYDAKTKKAKMDVLKTYNNVGVDFELSPLTKSLYVKADNTISKFDNTTGEITTIANNINTTKPLVLKSNLLVYNNNKEFYAYNIKTNNLSKIIDNAEELLIYKNSFIYRSNDTIYLMTPNKTSEIYKVHYNNLTNMQLIGKNTLQIVDTDTTDETKKRIINIDLSNKKYPTTQNENEYTNIVEYTKKTSSTNTTNQKSNSK